MTHKILMLAALAVALAACSGQSPEPATAADMATQAQPAADPITVTHRQGELVLERQPRRVIVQDVAVLDILDALGVDAVIGVPSRGLPGYLAQYGSEPYLKTGTLQEPDYEVISAAQPDLVILASRSRTALPEVSAIAPAIDLSVDNDNLVEGVKTNVTTLGEIFGKQERAAELNAELDAKFEELRARTAEAGTAIVLVTNAGRLGVYGNDSRLSWIFTEAGFQPVREEVDDRFHGGDAVSFEYILQANPDWLFVVDRDAGIGTSEGGAARKLLDNALVHQTNAWKQDQIVYLDPVPAYVVMHGITSLTRLADQVMEAVAAES